jgi:hypothetical protein
MKRGLKDFIVINLIGIAYYVSMKRGLKVLRTRDEDDEDPGLDEKRIER